ncbi:hypothetical protein LZ32DRAFT_400048 [Colletotrichum eremochloae]|nr:hypothetical protein LZ32DRAFT_400048 [Colletotrichum eremochloae]
MTGKIVKALHLRIACARERTGRQSDRSNVRRSKARSNMPAAKCRGAVESKDGLPAVCRDEMRAGRPDWMLTMRRGRFSQSPPFRSLEAFLALPIEVKALDVASIKVKVTESTAMESRESTGVQSVLGKVMHALGEEPEDEANGREMKAWRRGMAICNLPSGTASRGWPDDSTQPSWA